MEIAAGKSSTSELSKPIGLAELDKRISQALKKVQGSQETDLCRYLPGDGGYMHHLTYRRLKSKNPQKLLEMIDDHIIKVNDPKRVPPKQRKPHGLKRRSDLVALSRGDLEGLVTVLREAGEHELIAKLRVAVDSIGVVKKKLIASIRKNEADEELWNTFKECCRKETVRS